MLAQRLMWIGWPAFLVACVLEMLVFAVVDPDNLHWFGQPITWSHQGVYTIAFFLFWLVSALAGTLTLMLAEPGQPAIDRAED